MVASHDAEPEHRAHRSLWAGLAYLLTQPGRLRQGDEAVAGNHVVLAVARSGPFVLLAHLQRGSIAVRMGQRVQAGEVVAACGNSGNSTQPRVHLHAMDSLDWQQARGLPIVFRRPDGSEAHLPAEREIVRA